MKHKRVFGTIMITALLVTNISCDQISKRIVRTHISFNDKIRLIADHLTLQKIENKGAFLSLGDSLENPFRFILLTLLPVLALCVGLVFLFRRNNMTRETQIGMAFMLGGGIGNLYDRIIHGSVTDFLHIDLFLFQTGIFNMADVSIIIGMAILLFNIHKLNEITANPE
jgi:signal peptidase II